MTKRYIRKIQLQGTSLVVPLPRQIREAGGFIKGFEVEMEYSDGKITITLAPDHHAVKCRTCKGTGVVLVKKGKR